MERLRRAMLYVPGSNEKMMTKSLGIDADSLIIDLEDSVAPDVKGEARKLACEFIRDTDFGDKEVAVRINSLKTEYGKDDLNEMVQAQPNTLVIPKVEKAEELKELDSLITKIEKQQGFPVGGVGMAALIETPLGILNIGEIAMSCARLSGLFFGAGDFVRETRGRITRERAELHYPLMKIVVAARAANIDAVDSPYFDVRDLEGCEVNARQAKVLGYDGKSAIHPSQVEVINKVFTPTADEIDRAKRVIEVYEKAEKEGKGATQLDGQLIEHVHVTISKRVLKIAERLGAI